MPFVFQTVEKDRYDFLTSRCFESFDDEAQIVRQTDIRFFSHSDALYTIRAQQ